MAIKETFLPHLSEPLRRKIATNYIQHEFRKLFLQLRGQSIWQLMDEQVEKWYEQLSIRNFWNAIHGITMGFRLTSIVPWITSLNIKWVEEDIAIDDLWLRAKFHPVTPPDISESVQEVRKWLLAPEHNQILEQTKKYFAEKANETESRDYFPIFVVRKDKEKLRVIDGNGRLLKTIISGEKKIKAFVGEPVTEPILYEHWVPTSLLVDLVFWHKRQKELKKETTENTAKVIAELIRDSSAGRIEFTERAIHKDDEIHKQLLQAVTKIISI